jgi:hypothetical protein
MIANKRTTVGIAALAISLAAAGLARGGSPQFVPLYKNAWAPAKETNPNTSWLSWSGAYTATTYWLNFTPNLSLSAAQVQIVFTAVSPQSNVGVGIAVCGLGISNDPTIVPSFSNCKLIAITSFSDAGPTPNTNTSVWNPANDTYSWIQDRYDTTIQGCQGTGAGPHPCWADITAGLQRFVNAQWPAHVTIVTYGNGNNGPAVNEVSLMLNWN